MALLPCPYLGGMIELTDERQQHILVKHPDLLSEHFDHLVKTVADPDQMRRDSRFPATRLFARWFDDLKGGKFLIVAVASDPPHEEQHWSVTAYIARRYNRGVIEWMRN